MFPSGSETSLLEELGAVHTAGEIAGQPDLWLEIYSQISADKDRIMSFFTGSLQCTDRIILTGAGTSAFIGLSLSPVFSRHLMIRTDSVATTDLLSYPENYFSNDESIILV